MNRTSSPYFVRQKYVCDSKTTHTTTPGVQWSDGTDSPVRLFTRSSVVGNWIWKRTEVPQTYETFLVSTTGGGWVPFYTTLELSEEVFEILEDCSVLECLRS